MQAAATTWGLAVLALCCAAASAFPTVSETCTDANEEFGKVVLEANKELLRTGNLTVSVPGFEQDVFLSYSGASLVVKFHLTASGGSLGLTTAVPVGNATVCTSGSVKSLRGDLQFGQMELHYSSFHAKYLAALELDGTLNFRITPTVNVVVAKSPEGCRLDVVNFGKASQEYYVTVDSWTQFLVGQLIGKSLAEGGDSTPMMQYVQNSLADLVEAHLVKIWCTAAF